MKKLFLIVMVVLMLASCVPGGKFSQRQLPDEAIIVEELGVGWMVIELRGQLFLHLNDRMNSKAVLTRLETWENK